MAYTGRMAQMVWGSTPAAPTATPAPATPSGAAVTAGTSDLFQFGLPTGYTQKDLGDGRYEMFDTAGNSAGYGYKGVRDAIGELSYKNANAKTTNANGVWTNPYLQVAKSIWADVNGQEIDPSGYSQSADENGYGAFSLFSKKDADGNDVETKWVRQTEKMVNQEFSSEDEIKKQLEKYKQVGNYNGVMGDWEALGQVLEGNVAPNPQEWGNLPTDQKEQVIKGEGILYGSTPVFSKDGQLLGYRTDLTPNEAKDFNNGTDKAVQKDFGTFITHGGKSHSWNNANWRELSDPTAWQTNAVVGDGGTAFIPKGNEDKLSWTNKDSYAHQDHKMSGFMKVMADITKVADPLGYQIQGGDKFYEQAGKEGLFAALYDKWDPIVSKIDPIHKVIDKPISKALGFDTPKEAFTTIAPIVVAIAAAILTAGAASAAAGAAGGAGSGAAAGGAAATGAATTGAAAGAAGGAAAGAGSGMALAANILNGVNIANSVSKGDFGSALMQLATMGAGTAVGQSFLSSIGDIASDAATAVGIGQGAQGTVASMAKGFFAGDLGAMTGGVISFNPTIDKIIGASVRNAVKSAVVAGVTGAELDHVFATALASGVASLVGGAVGAGTQSATGSNVAGTIAGTVAGNLTGTAIRDATADTPDPVTRPTVTKPTTTLSNKFTAPVAKMIWS